METTVEHTPKQMDEPLCLITCMRVLFGVCVWVGVCLCVWGGAGSEYGDDGHAEVVQVTWWLLVGVGLSLSTL